MAWVARAVLHVADVKASLAFYVDKLGFASPWNFQDEVAQVERDGCALILSSQWPDKVGRGLMFVSLDASPDSAYVAELDALRAELESRGVAVGEAEWGYRVLVVTDPDGNELYFNYPNPR